MKKLNVCVKYGENTPPYSFLDVPQSRKLIIWQHVSMSNASSKEIQIILFDLPQPCPFTGPKIFWAGPYVVSQTKNLYEFCASPKYFVPHQKIISIQSIGFNASKKVFEKALNAIKFLDQHKTFWDMQQDKALVHCTVPFFNLQQQRKKNINCRCYVDKKTGVLFTYTLINEQKNCISYL